MRHVLKVLVILGLVVLACQAYAGDTANITVYVKIQALSVAISPTSYDFGTLTVNSAAVAVSSITVTNDGNVIEKFKLGITSEPNGSWTSVTAATPGSEQYRLSAIFKDVAPGSGNYGAEDSFSVSTERTATADDLAITADGEGVKGFNVAQTNSRGLWFKFETPLDTIITTTQSITAQITALVYP